MGEEYKCDICGAPASVHLTQIVDGKIHKVHLCEKCAAKSKVAELPILKFTEMLAKTLASGGKKSAEEVAGTEAVGREPTKICPVCGMTDVVFEKKHLFGCPHCYEVFSEEISAMLPKIQRGKNYRGDAFVKKNAGGKTPSAAKDAGTLRAELKSAVEKEDYALAARLRDELRALEAEGKKKTRVPAAKKRPSSKGVPAAAPKKKARPSPRPRGNAGIAGKKKSSGGRAA